MTEKRSVVIVAAKRTPIGSFMGSLSSLPAHKLAATAIKALMASTSVAPENIDEVTLGCVLSAGLGQAPARQAVINAGLPSSIPCTTLNKVCGSGMKAVMQSYDSILLGNADCMIAGGMESMSQAPYLLPNARGGMRFGHGEVLDHMLYDGLQDAYEGEPMGIYAERCVEKFGFTREQQDAYAIESVRRAIAACSSDVFDEETAPITIPSRGGEQLIEKDETPFKCKPEKIPDLKPAFKKEGSVTAASSASISDGAAVLMLMEESRAKSLGLTPMARIVAHSSHAMAPEDFTLAPIHAIDKLYSKTGWCDEEVGLYEINEAFAAVTMAAMQELKLDHSKVNIYGGACALGHPIGATGARIIVTLLHAMMKHNKQKGIASLCIGGGEATAVALEKV